MENPKIRFKGFTKDWEQRKLEAVLSLLKDGTHGTHQDADEGPYLLSAKNIKNGQIIIDDSSDRKISEDEFNQIHTKFTLENGDILLTIVGSIGESAILESAGKFTFQRSVAFLRPSEEMTSRFLKTEIESVQFQKELNDRKSQSAQPGVYLGDLSKIPIYITSKEEQKKIGKYFSHLDHLITLHQRKCEQTKKLKKYMLQKMFPQNGAKVPEIRFDGFTYDWEQRKFSDLYAPLVERNSDLLPYNKTLSVATMTYKIDGNGAADSSLANYKRLRTGDIAFEGHTSKSFRYGRFVLNDVGDGIMSPRFSALRPLAQMPTNFWKYYIHYEPIMRKILVASTKAGTMMNELVIDEFLKSSVLVPSIEEQTRIGSILKNIDHLITLHQRKCDELKKMKKYMLQNMFI